MSRLPASVLYVCSMNRVRSPMAAGLTRKLYGDALQVDSSGLHASEEVDMMAAVVMQEVGVDLLDHRPRPMEGVHPAARASWLSATITLKPAGCTPSIGRGL